MIASHLLSPAAIATAPAPPACPCPELPTFRRLSPRVLGQPTNETTSTARFSAAKCRAASSTPRSFPPPLPAREPLHQSALRPTMAAAAGGESGPGEGPPRVMIVSDLDNTMVDHKDEHSDSLRRFSLLWDDKYAKDSLLVYSTGRSPSLYLELKAHKPLRTPDIVICSVGTEICVGPDMKPDEGWERQLDNGWDRQAVLEETAKFPKLRPQADSEQRPHKVSFNVEKDDAASIVGTLDSNLKARGLRAKIIYSGGYDLDVLPEGAGKGRALEYLLQKLRREGRYPGRTLVCGDSGNDIELFTVREEGVYGVIVGNAMEELRAWHQEQSAEGKEHVFCATERCAAGIMQAMEKFQF